MVVVVLDVMATRVTEDAGDTKADADDRDDTKARSVNSKCFIIMAGENEINGKVVPSCEYIYYVYVI